jgi:glycosyltransferase involved in cell wall biosynthesis
MNISVIIPAYNAENYIMDCIKSIRNQRINSEIDIEILIGVDGCKKTSEILSKNKISHFYSYNNVGSYVIRNSLMSIAYGEYFIYFDADDVMLPDFISKCISQKTDICMPAKFQCNEHLIKIKQDSIIESGGAMCFSEKVLDTLGGFCSERCGADTDFMRRAELAGYKIEKIETGLYLRRRHGRSLTKSGITRSGGEYRKNAWEKMTADRNAGKIKIVPRITALEKRFL